MADLVQCVNDNILGEKIGLNKIYNGVKYNTSEGKYYVIHNLLDKNDIIGRFPSEDFKLVESVTLSDIMEENSGKIFLAIGTEDKILVKKQGLGIQYKNLSIHNSKWQDMTISNKWFNYAYKIYNPPVTFDKAAKSKRRFKHINWTEFYNLKRILWKLSEYEDETINKMLNSQSWIIEE